MSTNQDESVFPLCNWTVREVKGHGAILWTPFFLSTPFDTIEQAQQGRTYVLPPKLARELAQSLLKAADHVEQNTSPVPESLKS